MSSSVSCKGLRGVGSIDRIGNVEREIRVGLDPVRLQAVGLTPLDVSRQLSGSNVDLAGGRAEIGGRDQAIRTLAGAKTLGNLAATKIGLPSGGEVRLDDLGLVTDTVAEPRTFARFDGKPVVGFSIFRAKGASDVTVAEVVAARVKAIEKEHPEVDLKLIDIIRSPNARKLLLGGGYAVRRSYPRGDRGFSIFARLASDHYRGDHIAAVDLSGFLGHVRSRISRSTW